MNIKAAIGNFFEGGAANELETEPSRPSGQAFDDDDDDDDDLDFNPNPSRGFGGPPVVSASRPETRKKEPAKTDRGKIFTLRDAADEDEEGEDERGQAFYAGGSETSGQQILGPSRKNAENFIKDIFKKAKE